VWAYNQALIDAVFDDCACFKVQIAYYEALGLAGLAVYAKTLDDIRQRGGLVIADVKRGDIADTASQYAKAHFSGDFEADFVTLSPFMGVDTLEPWLELADKTGKGAFVLTRTSNRGAADFEYQALAGGRPLYEAVGDRIAALGTGRLGKSGYAAFGAVIGCTDDGEAAAMRARWPSLFFLIPGYGAQGGAAKTCGLLMRGGSGVVNASRSVLMAWSQGGNAVTTLEQAAQAARQATQRMRNVLTA
jgi:orotidine-5'-phosphate decarboxylase